MTTVTHDTEHDEHHDEHHPTDAKYWKVGALLGLLTLLEVSTYFVTDDPYSHELKWFLIIGLLVLMVAKFITIIGYFMHLKFDNKLFRNVFVSGLVLAVGVYLIVLTTFVFWTDDYEAGLQLLS